VAGICLPPLFLRKIILTSTLVSGWNKTDKRRYRRAIVLKRCHNDKWKAGQAMMEFYNSSRDPEARRLARADALHFFNLCRRNGKNEK